MFLRRNAFPIKNRAPAFIVLFIAWNLVFIIVLGFSESENCALVQWMEWLCIPFMVTTIIMRYLHTWATYTIQHRIIRNENLHQQDWKERIAIWFSNVRHLMVLFWLIIIFLCLVVFLPLSLSYDLYRYNEHIGSRCVGSDSFYRSILIVNMLVSIPCIIQVCALWNIEEFLFIKLELRFLSVTFVILFNHHILGLILLDKVEPIAFNMILLLILSICLLLFLIPTVPYLLWKSYREERHRKMLETSLPAISGSLSASSTDSISLSVTPLGSTPARNTSSSLSSYSTSIRRVLNDDAGREDFKQFLSLELCAENIKFWEAVNEYRTTTIDRLALARKLVRQYIGSTARTPVNISGRVADAIITSIKQEHAPTTLFDDGQDQIMEMLYCGEFQRFIHSDFYKDKQ